MSGKIEAQLAVLGGGPAGYTAAFRAADLGVSVTVVEKREVLGGVCLNVGCIPSKTLLHCAAVMDEVKKLEGHGIRYGSLEIDIDAVRANKETVTAKLTSGLEKLCEARKIRIVRGSASFVDKNTLAVKENSEVSEIRFQNIIIAAGSRPVRLPQCPENSPGIWSSTDALALKEIPARLLVVGAGIIGLEMAAVYSSLGSKVTVVELLDQIIPPADPDLVRPLYRKLKKELASLLLETSVIKAEKSSDSWKVTVKDKKGKESDIECDAILVAVGRRPNGDMIGAENAGIAVDEKGFIRVNSRMESSVKGIYAAGDITGNPMLAHRASHQGKVAAEVVAGLPSEFSAMAIPSVAYTIPEVAWMGLTEKEAAAEGIGYKKGVFPWSASGKALSGDNGAGFTKLLFNRETGRLAGAGITGNNAGELISETVLALEMGAFPEDIGHTIHPHPTLAESIAFAAEAAAGTVTDILPQKNREEG